MPRTSDIVLGGRIMVMLKGDNGSGKTVLAASFPGPIKFFMFDGSKLDVVKMFFPNRTDIEYDIFGARATKFRDANNQIVQIKSLIQFAEEFNALMDYCPWATVVLDSFTSFSVTCVTFQLDVRSSSADDKKNPLKSKGGLVIPDFDEYKGETTLVTQSLDVSKVLPCHVIWTAHPLPKLETSGQGAGMRVTKSSSIAAYGAKTAAMAPSYFNEVWHLETRIDSSAPGGRQRIVHTQSTGEQFAKTALPLPVAFDVTGKPGFPEVQRYLNEHNVKLSEKVASKAEQETATAEREEIKNL
jgi:hypothetical protein